MSHNFQRLADKETTESLKALKHNNKTQICVVFPEVAANPSLPLASNHSRQVLEGIYRLVQMHKPNKILIN